MVNKNLVKIADRLGIEELPRKKTKDKTKSNSGISEENIAKAKECLEWLKTQPASEQTLERLKQKFIQESMDYDCVKILNEYRKYFENSVPNRTRTSHTYRSNVAVCGRVKGYGVTRYTSGYVSQGYAGDVGVFDWALLLNKHNGAKHELDYLKKVCVQLVETQVELERMHGWDFDFHVSSDIVEKVHKQVVESLPNAFKYQSPHSLERHILDEFLIDDTLIFFPWYDEGRYETSVGLIGDIFSNRRADPNLESLFRKVGPEYVRKYRNKNINSKIKPLLEKYTYT